MKILVYSGTGSQGSAVVRAALRAGHTPYIVTRQPDKAAELVGQGAQVAHADMTDAASLRQVSEGMDAVALTVPAFIPNPMDMPKYLQNALDAAKAAGIQRLSYNTSGPVIEGMTGNPMYDGRHYLIQSVWDSGIPAVIIQPTAYLENLLGPWTRPNIVARDVLSYPVDETTPIGWIATDDVGAFMIAALEHPELTGERMIVSGMENLTGPELAERFTRGLGRTISYYNMPLDEFGAALDAAFGPGAGEGGKQGYAFQRDNKDRIPMWTDMQPVLAKLPIEMTPVEVWAGRFAPLFAPHAQGETQGA